MDFLSKLFGKKEATPEEKDAIDLFKKIVDEASKEQTKKPESKPEPKPQPAPEENRYDDVPDGPSGESWGPRMPAEENQYNFNGTYQQYFEKIFAEEFSGYRVEKEQPKYKGVVYSFYSGERKALVVELLPSSSESKKLREKCKAANIPYLRYYYDYEGWWNTRAYVVKRTKNALA